MPLRIQNSIYLFVLVVCFTACKNNTTEKPIAQVFDNYLYQKDILNIIPEGISKEDSITLINNYIQQWIKEQVIIEKAKKNVDEKFEKQLEDYKNSLIVYEYEQQIVNKLLDTNVTNNEIEEYYEKNKDNFLLKNNIVKVLYVKLNKNSNTIIAAKKLLFKSVLDDKTKIEIDKLAATSVNFYLDEQKWLIFNDLLKEIPIETYNQELFLQNNRNITIEDENFVYLARIIDFKIKETISPLSLEKDNIKTIIINKRKVELIQKMHQELLKDAEIRKEIKFFNNIAN